MESFRSGIKPKKSRTGPKGPFYPIFKPSNLKLLNLRVKLRIVPVNLSKPAMKNVLVTESQQEGLIS
jgi:hypothetical protein